MQPRRHRMRKEQRRSSARKWVQTSLQPVTVRSYARWYGVDGYTAYEDLTAIGFKLPAKAAQHWSKRPPAVPRRRKAPPVTEAVDDSLIMVDGRMYFIAGYTSGGAPYGTFIDEPAADDHASWEEPPF